MLLFEGALPRDRKGLIAGFMCLEENICYSLLTPIGSCYMIVKSWLVGGN